MEEEWFLNRLPKEERDLKAPNVSKTVPKKLTSVEELLETIKTEIGERTQKRILAKLPIAEAVIRKQSGTKHLRESTRMRILLAVLGAEVLPGRYSDILQLTSFQEREIYSFRKNLILRGVLPNRFVDRKRELLNQALQHVAEADIDLALKGKAVKVLTQVTQRHYVPSVKSSKVLAAIALKAAAEAIGHEIPTIKICKAVGSSYLPQNKVIEFLKLIKSHVRDISP
ncbi:MAG: hypothetical protein ACE5I5_10725 [Candidatus Heimdallarchaeota archaeon]